MRRPHLIVGAFVAALGAFSAFWRFQEEELKKYLPLAMKMGIRK